MVNSRELLAKIKRQLTQNSEFEATELLCHFAGLSRAALLRGDAVSEEGAQTALNAALRRKNGEPLQYILGEWEFDGEKILCRPGVLIPREDTLCLVEHAQQRAESIFPAGNTLRILDIGCGSGCAGLSLLKRLQEKYTASLLAIDIKQECLELTKENAELWHLSESVQTQLCDILKEVPAGTFDILLSNPPYIKSADIEALDTEVRSYEPRLALDGGEDGLQFYRRIAEIAKKLIPFGVVAVETGYDTGEAVRELFQKHGYAAVELHHDSSGQPRAVCAVI